MLILVLKLMMTDHLQPRQVLLRSAFLYHRYIPKSLPWSQSILPIIIIMTGSLRRNRSYPDLPCPHRCYTRLGKQGHLPLSMRRRLSFDMWIKLYPVIERGGGLRYYGEVQKMRSMNSTFIFACKISDQCIQSFTFNNGGRQLWLLHYMLFAVLPTYNIYRGKIQQPCVTKTTSILSPFLSYTLQPHPTVLPYHYLNCYIRTSICVIASQQLWL